MPASNRITINRTNAISLVFCLSLLVLITTACGILDRLAAEKVESDNSTAASNSSSGNSDPTPTSDPETVRVSGPCMNEYYPVDDGMVRHYEVSGSGPGKYTLIQKELAESTFKEERSFESGLVINNNWICTPDGLRAAEFMNTGVMKSGRFQMETVKSTGVTIPRDFEAGKEFASEYDVAVKLKAGPVTADATGKVEITNKIISVNAPITVKGKTYDASRIDSVIKIVVTVNGRTMQSGNFTTSNWFAKGAGLLKQETGGTFGKESVELVSIERK